MSIASILLNNGVFLSYYLNNSKKEDIASLAQGVSVVHLYSSQLSTLNINLPSSEEQTKIAEFLSAVDDKISQLSRQLELLKQYKKGVMQKIFSQEIRFKNENGEVIDTIVPDERVEYLKKLKNNKRALAEEYIRRTPTQIETHYRSLIEKELDWKPIL